MQLNESDLSWRSLPGTLPVRHAVVSREQLLLLCRDVAGRGARLVSLWGEDRRAAGVGYVLVVVLDLTSRLLLTESISRSPNPGFPDLSQLFPSAGRMQRATHDLLGFNFLGADARPWLRHSAWAKDAYPLRHDFVAAAVSAPPLPTEIYPFVRVEGDGAHEIAVGPVHAGTIEPGHFRFSVVGEKVLRLEQQLGYTHKGIEKRFEGLSVQQGSKLAARVSGDSAVAYAWAYAMAVESLTDTQVPARALALRALLLERERLANHLGDLGGIGNDAGLSFGLAQFSRLKEDLLRVNAKVWGARYLFDEILPGGVATDLAPTALPILLDSLAAMAAEVAVLQDIYDNHAGLQDRFHGAGVLSAKLARQLGVVGLAARASGQAQDWRAALEIPPYDGFAIGSVLAEGGDVAARVAVRFDEIAESLQVCRGLLTDLPSGEISVAVGKTRADELAVGGIEGWRGPILVGLRVAADGRIARCHPHDPSWLNWPALEHAIIDNIVPDFPLINKSFNLSYSGQDL